MAARKALGHESRGELARGFVLQIDEVGADRSGQQRVRLALVHLSERDNRVGELHAIAHGLLLGDRQVVAVDAAALEQERRQSAASCPCRRSSLYFHCVLRCWGSSTAHGEQTLCH